jgi:hypothetical protein
MQSNTPQAHGIAPCATAAAGPDATPRPPTADDALALARCGLQILPCAPRTKQPAKDLTHWQDRATLEPETIRDWWQQYPDANVGHVIGHRRLVVDIDVKAAKQKDGRVWWKRMLAEHGDVPPTWQVWSGSQEGGFHLYFAVPDTFQVPNHTDLAPDVEALGCDHLVILPPSIHEETRFAYRWDETGNPFTLLHPANAPDWLLNEIRWATATRRDWDNRGRRPNTAKPSDESLCLSESTKIPEEVPPRGTLVDTEAKAKSPKKGHGDHLIAMACDPTNLPSLLDACGLPSTLQVGDSTRCPFHDDEHPSAWLRGPTSAHRTFALYCFACEQYFAFVDIYKHRRSANILTIHTEQDGKGQRLDHHRLRLMWTTRMLEEAGLVHTRTLGAPSLPPDAPQGLRDLWGIFLHAGGIRAATSKAFASLPFSWRFIQDWSGDPFTWTQHATQKWKCYGIGRGIWHPVGEDDQGNTLWAVGRKELRKARRATPIFKTERATLADVATTVVPEPVEPTPACPEAHEFSHDARQCVACIQARLLERRAQAGIWVDPSDPYGRRSLGRSPT